jgi:hypothetical protein
MRAGQVRQTMRQTTGKKGDAQMNALTEWLKNFWIRRPFLASGIVLFLSALFWWAVAFRSLGVRWSLIFLLIILVKNAVMAVLAIAQDNANRKIIEQSEDALPTEDKEK